jgi:hypothetical protein
MWDDDDEGSFFEDNLWIDGAYGGPDRSKTLEDWKKSKKYKVISKDWPIWKARKAMKDLSQIAMKWTKTEVKDKLTMKTTSELIPSSVFNEDSDGEHIAIAITLRAIKATSKHPTLEEGSRDPVAQEAEINKLLKRPKQGTPEWHTACLLEKYCSLNDTEFMHVRELVRVYDHSRCYFVRDILDTSFQKLINSERLEAEYNKKEFKWEHYESAILRQLVNIETEAQLFHFVNDQRPPGMTAKLWASQRIQFQSLLEGSGKIKLDESIYLTFLVGWMSDQEINIFNLPAIGDDFSGWTLKRAKEEIDKCTKPPKFNWSDTPLSKMIKEKLKTKPIKKESHRNEKDKTNKKQPALENNNTEKKSGGKPKRSTPQDMLEKRPSWEKPSAFPSNLKEPTDKYLQKKLLHADIVSGACTRCHKFGHLRNDCKLEKQDWERVFDWKGKKGTYWTSVATAQEALEHRMYEMPSDLLSYGNSSFSPGNAMRATATCMTYPTTNSNGIPVCITCGIDSMSDVSISTPDVAYNVRDIDEDVSTGGGNSNYTQEGLIDIQTSPGVFEAMPVLISNSTRQLPRGCNVLVGMEQIKDLRISLDHHSTENGLLLTVKDELVSLMSEKDLVKWWDKNKDKPANYVPYTADDVDINPDLPPDHIRQIKELTDKYKDRFDATKGDLPPPADHPPITLNFKDDWKPVHTPEPRWGPGSTAVIGNWAKHMVKTGAYKLSKSSPASRLHLVKKLPPRSPEVPPS